MTERARHAFRRALTDGQSDAEFTSLIRRATDGAHAPDGFHIDFALYQADRVVAGRAELHRIRAAFFDKQRCHGLIVRFRRSMRVRRYLSILV